MYYYKIHGRFLNESQYRKWKRRQPKPKTGTLLDYMEYEFR